jgi:group II intron reverse transcriptase/maturase
MRWWAIWREAAMSDSSSLFEMVCDGYHLHRAWMEVRDGRTAPARQRGAGVDGVTVADWEADWPERLAALQADLLRGNYRPSPLLWFDIPRRHLPSAPPPQSRGIEEGQADTRRLGIPTVTDRVAQRAAKNALEPTWEAVFLSCSHGFRPERSVFTAIAHVLWHQACGRNWVADADIEAYFDTVEHRRLLDQLAALGDGRLVELIAGWLEVGAAAPGRGVAQGAVISPLLANIYLHPFDVRLVRAGLALVRYADDVVVMCASPDEAREAMAWVALALEELGLALNQDKSAVLPFGPDFTFLGAQFNL